MYYKTSKNLTARFFTLWLIVFCFFAQAKSAPDFLTFDELTTLYEQEVLPQNLEEKLGRLLTTPFVDNSQKTSFPLSLTKSAALGEYLRVVCWNIERGLEYEAVEAAFTSRERFEALLNEEDFPLDSRERQEILEQVAALQTADVIILNEVDWGMKRTEYRNVAADLAEKLKLNYAFGVQFVELTPVHLNQTAQRITMDEKEVAELLKLDTARYKGLHGIAILSRFPLENVRLVPFKTQPYDWYKEEKKGVTMLEKTKRKLAKIAFAENVSSEVRRGGRTTLLADIVDERFPSGRVSIAATHLENRTKSKNRAKQLEELLETVKEIKNPLVVAGDMNTSGSDLTPTSIRRELMKRYGNPKYWLKQAVQYALGFGLVEDASLGIFGFGRKYADPTVRDIPFFSPNAARKFFTTLRKFRFADGNAFDFRGDEIRSTGGKKKTLANSNQRGAKGFITTYQVARPVYILGKYKLDWIFVKPAALKNPTDKQQSYQFAPHFGRTLTLINEATENRLSDHRPMLVDLPLGEPNLSPNF
ncbi:MAG TPA: endonuclease/exonuclease/phosphatase family protein [Pyrinomonadaceae bacterium]|nr:endonuclease/exonuclease/phosphatase family protein [Pyrinomonadaceae bacterium]